MVSFVRLSLPFCSSKDEVSGFFLYAITATVKYYPLAGLCSIVVRSISTWTPQNSRGDKGLQTKSSYLRARLAYRRIGIL